MWGYPIQLQVWNAGLADVVVKPHYKIVFIRSVSVLVERNACDVVLKALMTNSDLSYIRKSRDEGEVQPIMKSLQIYSNRLQILLQYSSFAFSETRTISFKFTENVGQKKTVFGETSVACLLANYSSNNSEGS